MKVCNCCKAEKSSTEFFKDSSKKDGLSTLCKPCKYAAHKKWVAAHPEKMRAYKDVYASVPENQVKKNAQQRKARSDNRDAYNAKSRAYYAENKDRAYANARKWWLANPERVAQYKAERRAAHRNAFFVPTEDDLFLVEEAYSLRDLRNKLTGKQWEVDHVIPLNNELVCGLHAWWNLQVIPMRANRSKHNTFKNEDALAFSGSDSRFVVTLAPR